MKQIRRLILMMVVLFLLAACGSPAPEGAGGAASFSPEGAGVPGGFEEGALPEETQLAVGTLLLEDTEMAVDGEMAEALLPYWKMYRSLAVSDTAAPDEMASVIKQIKEIMTAEQLNAIAALDITPATMRSLMQDLDILEERGAESEEGDSESAFPGGGPPEGFQPGRGQGMTGPGGLGGGEGDVDPEAMATLQAEREERRSGMPGSQLLIPVVEELIAVLENK